MWKRIVTAAILLALLNIVSTKLILKGSPLKQNKYWRQVEEVHPSTPMRLTIALKERNMNVVEERLAKTSDPTSSEYGKHMSWEELTALTGATDEQIRTVSSWLKSHDIEHEVTPSRSFIRVRTTVARAEKMLNCNLRAFETVAAPKKKIIRCIDSYFVPEEIDQLIDFVGPVHGFPKPRATGKRGMASRYNDNDIQVTPSLIRKLYNVTVGQSDMHVQNTQAVFESGDNYKPSDLQGFFQTYAPDLQGQKIAGEFGNERNDPFGTVAGEATIDVEYIMGIGRFAPTYWYGYNDTNDIIQLFLEYAMDLANDPHPPLVNSISYGAYGGNYPIEHVLRVSNEWMKLGARGITMFVASGDDGVGCNEECTQFEFPYPSSPYITLVGGTMVYQDSNDAYMYEVGWNTVNVNGGSSSGGFSGDFPIPSWQATQVAQYLQQPNLPTSFFNATGRGLPDLSAPADNVMVVIYNTMYPMGGTSCAAPIIAGLFSLINGVRLQAGKTSVGFINPAIYKLSTLKPNAFYDVTQGSNPSSEPCCAGFTASKGWDPVTGLGTPNFEVMLKYFAQLP